MVDVFPIHVFIVIDWTTTDIFALVTYLPGDDSYRFHIYSEESVPLFGPSLPSPPIFPKVSDFREFLLVKRESTETFTCLSVLRLFWLVVSAIDKIGRRSSSCVSVSTTETDEMMTTSVTIFFVSPHAHAHAVINGEKAAFNTPIFSQKRERTLDMLIRDMYAEVMTEHRGVSSSSSWPSIVASVFHNKSREKMKRHFPAIQKNRSIFDDCVILFLNMDWIFE